MTSLKYKPLVLAMALTAPLGAQAQDAGMEQLEEIVVTGSFRESLATALDQKRGAIGSVDAIVADDIASFPDLNLAESLQRIPGVAITRAAGEGRNISVRGLGPEFTRVRINGMEAMATGGGTDAIGGANRGRGFDFNTFASELFNNLTVRKTAAANVEEGSLGATVDMRTARPFDYDEFTFAASGQLGYNDLSEETDPKVSALIANTFADGTIGALLSVSYSERNIRDEGASTVRWDNSNDFGRYQGDANAPELAGINDGFRPRLPRYDSYHHTLERTGIAGALQFQPSENTDINLDLLYAKLDAQRNERFMQGILNNTAIAANMNVLDYRLDNTNTVTAASFEDAVVRSENRMDELTTEFTQFTLSGTQHLSDRLRLNGMIGQADSEFDNPVQTTIVAQKEGLDFAYDYSGGHRENPLLVFDPAVQELSGWDTNSVRLRPLGAENRFSSAEFDLEFDVNEALTLKGGINYKNYEFDTFEARRSSEGDGGGVVLNADTMMTHDAGLGRNNPWAAPNLDAIASTYDLYRNAGPFAVSIENRLADNYSAEEESTGIFAQLVFDARWGDLPVRGDLGVRHVRTDQSSSAWATLGDDDEQVTAEHDYRETLPSINLVFEPLEDVLIRASYAQVMARAGLNSIRPNVSVSASGGSRTVSGGNPALEPTRATNYDLGVELYFDDESMLSLAVFRKDIESHVQRLRETKPFTETGLPVSAAVEACEAGPGYGGNSGCDENVEWEVTSPLNGPGGPLYGFEVSYQQPFTFLPGLWSHIGFIGNFTYVKAQMDYLNADGQVQASRDLLGLSEDTSSATLYYEDDALSARVSVVDRSGYLDNAIGRNNNDREGTNGTINVDASLGYQINDNVKVSFEGLNLTDEVDDKWVDASGNRLSYYHATGRQFYLGIQYTY